MVLSHSCHIYRIWRSKDVKGCFKVIIWGGNASHKKGDSSFGNGGSYWIL